MSLTTSKASYRANFGPLMPQTFIAPYPYCLHCKARQAAPDGKDWYKVGCHAVLTLHVHSFWGWRCCGCLGEAGSGQC